MPLTCLTPKSRLPTCCDGRNPCPSNPSKVQFDDGIWMDDDPPLHHAAESHLSDYAHPAADPAISLQYNRTRWFDPAEGVWLSTEPAGYWPSDDNLFRYVANDPMDDPEPNGL